MTDDPNIAEKLKTYLDGCKQPFPLLNKVHERLTALEAENKELREALLDAAANLIGAVSAYNNYVGRVDQQGKKDPFFNTRYKDFRNAENRIIAVLRKLKP